MSKKTVVFQKFGKSTIKEIDDLFSFTILYHDKWSLRNTIKQSDFVVVAACRGLAKISLEEMNGKNYLFITDDISNFVSYPEEIDNFLSRQSDSGNVVTTEMLYHAIMDSTDKLFPKMRMTDIYYNYKYLKNQSVSTNVDVSVDIYTSDFDKYIHDIFPNSRDAAIKKIVALLNVTPKDAMTLFERWQQFYFIDYLPCDDWIPCSPRETLTIEQFKAKTSIDRIEVKKYAETGLLYFEAGNIKGIVMLREVPKHPMLSHFFTSDSREHWLLHEEGSISAAPIIAVF